MKLFAAIWLVSALSAGLATLASAHTDLSPGQGIRVETGDDCDTSVVPNLSFPDEARCNAKNLSMKVDTNADTTDLINNLSSQAIARVWVDFTVTSSAAQFDDDLVPIWIDWDADWKGRITLVGVNEPNGSTASLRWQLIDQQTHEVIDSGTIFDHTGREETIFDPTGSIPVGVTVAAGTRLQATARRGSIATLVNRGRSYRLRFGLTCDSNVELFKDIGTLNTRCNYSDRTLGFGVGASVDFVRLKAGLDPTEVSATLNGVSQMESELLGEIEQIRVQVEELRSEFEGHTHGYRTGRGVGQNNVEAETGMPRSAATAATAQGASALAAPSSMAHGAGSSGRRAK